MAEPTAVYPIDRKSGYCPDTRTFYSLRPAVPLPSPYQSISLADYVFYLLHLKTVGAFTSSFPPDTPFLIDAATDSRLTYSDLLLKTRALAASIQTLVPSLSKNDVAFVLAPTSIHVPVIYFALLSIGVTISPANPLATESELAHMVKLSKPVIAFATRETSSKLPELPLGIVLIDSVDFNSMMQSKQQPPNRDIKINQADSAAILYSSGTTGRVKGVELSHRNFIAMIAGMYYLRRLREEEQEKPTNPVSLIPIPLFHVFGFFMLLRAAAMGETLVLMERFNFEKMLQAVEKYRIEYMPVSPPLVVALSKSDIVMNYDLSSLTFLGCGGAPLGKEVVERFAIRFPNVDISQGYGLTESAGAATRMATIEETKHYGSAGMLSENYEAKIVDPVSGEALGPGQRGEIWLRGPAIMKGYIGDIEANAATLDPEEGWLKTGDLGYFDENGFLFIVDRLKELIKYKGYQVPPAELEHLLNAHPEIADSAVIPYPDEEAGEIPMAYIVRKHGSSVNEGQIIDYVAKQVSPYKKVRKVAFIGEIPKAPSGKILRRELVKHAAASAGISSRL